MGLFFGSQTEGNAIIKKNKTSGAHGYFPTAKGIQTGFVANGAGIVAGFRIRQMTLTDIAPFIADLLGINFPPFNSKSGFMNHFLK